MLARIMYNHECKAEKGGVAMGVGILEAKNNLSSLVRSVESGELDRVVIERYGKPVVQIVPYQPVDSGKRIGLFDGTCAVSSWEAFDAMDDEIAEEFGV